MLSIVLVIVVVLRLILWPVRMISRGLNQSAMLMLGLYR